MDTSKIIKGVVSNGRYTVTAPIVKEDYGLYLKIEGVELPETYQVDFSNSENSGTSVTMIGNADGVLIPHQFIDTGKDIFAFLYHVGQDFGRTVYKFRIPNKVRPDRTNEEPTPEEQSTIDQLIGAMNTAVAQTAQDKVDADASAQNASADAERAEEAKVDAQNFATQAEQSATDAHESASQASASATASAQSASQAEQSAQTASAKADAITGLTATAQTLPSESSATANYNPETGVMSFGIPKGKDGIDGDDGYSPTASVNKRGLVTTITITDKTGTTSARVMDGAPGVDGRDGYSPTASVSKSGKVTTITITDKTGTTSAQVEDGTDGTDGISPTVTITPITGGHRITITDADGEHSADVMDGDDYTLTAQDKQDIAELVDVPVNDVQIGGTSIVNDGVANVPIASASDLGVAKVNSTRGIKIENNTLAINRASSAQVKSGGSGASPLTPVTQHESTFYGLAKAAEDTTQSKSSNEVGQYTDTAKGKIQTMLGIADLIGNSEGATASKAYSVGDVLLHDGKLYKVTASIAQGSAIVPNTNCTQTTIIDLLRGV